MIIKHWLDGIDTGHILNLPATTGFAVLFLDAILSIQQWHYILRIISACSKQIEFEEGMCEFCLDPSSSQDRDRAHQDFAGFFSADAIEAAVRQAAAMKDEQDDGEDSDGT